MNTSEKLWTLREFAEKIHQHVDSVRLKIESGAITAINVGTEKRATWVIPDSAVQDFFNRRTNRVIERQQRLRNATAAKSRELDDLLDYSCSTDRSKW